MQIGTQVKVTEVTKSGRERAPWIGVIEDERRGVKSLGSIEYLVKDESGRSQWVISHFVAAVVKA